MSPLPAVPHDRAHARLQWIDAAKGLAIALVVLTHTTIFVERAGHASDAWGALNRLLIGLRMPLFFTVSGLLAAPVPTRPWRQVLRGRVLPHCWLFVVWLALTTTFFALGGWVRAGQPASAPQFAASLVRPHTELWYLYALALFVVCTRALRVLPVPVQLLAAASLSISTSAGVTATGSWAWDNMAVYLVFFLAGCHGRDVLLARVGAARVGTALLLAGAFALAAVAVAGLDLHTVPGLVLLRGALGVLAGSTACVVLARHWPRNPLRVLGRATLPVYLTHVLLIAVLATAVQLLLPATLPLPVRTLLPAVLTVAVIVLGLLAQRALTPVPGLMAPPHRLTGRALRTA